MAKGKNINWDQAFFLAMFVFMFAVSIYHNMQEDKATVPPPSADTTKTDTVGRKLPTGIPIQHGF